MLTKNQHPTNLHSATPNTHDKITMASDPTPPGPPSAAHHDVVAVVAAHSQPPDTPLGPNPAEGKPSSKILFEDFFYKTPSAAPSMIGRIMLRGVLLLFRK